MSHLFVKHEQRLAAPSLDNREVSPRHMGDFLGPICHPMNLRCCVTVSASRSLPSASFASTFKTKPSRLGRSHTSANGASSGISFAALPRIAQYPSRKVNSLLTKPGFSETQQEIS